MDKSTDKQISIIMKQMGFDPLELTKELRKMSVQRMSLKERCEHINQMKQPFGIVRCTPHRLLKKWFSTDWARAGPSSQVCAANRRARKPPLQTHTFLVLCAKVVHCSPVAEHGPCVL